MADFVLKTIMSSDIEKELYQIGFDEGYRYVASDKFRYKNIKIFNLTSAQANILKQTALSVGADCATHRDVITGKADYSDVILGGSFSQLKKITDKLKKQPFSLSKLSEQINNLIKDEKTTKTKLAGILNVTPDSFSDGGKYIEPVNAQKRLMQMIEEGADIIDIGAESTRPYSEAVSPEEQIRRLKPVIEFIQKENIRIPISVDTRSAVVADYVLNSGAEIINDVSGFEYDENIANVISRYNASVIIQHTKGCPKDMQDNPEYNNLIDEIYLSLKNKIEYAQSIGIKDIIIDPGIGFGKTKEDNFEILNRIEEFYPLSCPVMVGVSRKSLLDIKEDNNDLKDSLTLAISYPLIQKGVDYLRVHNVSLHKSLINSIAV